MSTGERISATSDSIDKTQRQASYQREREAEEICRANKVERGFDTTQWSVILERLSREGKLYLQQIIPPTTDEDFPTATVAQEILPVPEHATDNLHTLQPEA